MTPYYNKATQKGLIASFTAIADGSPIPLVLYNVPSRTGVNILPETYGVLADHPNIAAVKEANGDISAIAETLEIVGDRLDVYSGNDDQTLPILALGGKGVVSQLKFLPLIKALFSEVNPIPAKAAMSAMGYGENVLRLPLTPMNEEKKEKLFSLMRQAGIALSI